MTLSAGGVGRRLGSKSWHPAPATSDFVTDAEGVTPHLAHQLGECQDLASWAASSASAIWPAIARLSSPERALGHPLVERRPFDQLHDQRRMRRARLGWLGGVTCHWTLGESTGYSEGDAERDRAWRAPEAPPTARHALFVELWRLLQHASRPRPQYLLNVLRGWVAAPLVGQPPDRALTIAELRALAAGGLIEVGAHTVTHPILKGLAAPVQCGEVLESKVRLEELLDRPFDSFAYPYGTAAPDTVPRAADPLRLPRFTVEDWDGGEFLQHLARWTHE